MKLPEMKLMERGAVAEYVIQNELSGLDRKIQQKMCKLNHPSVLTRNIAKNLNRTHDEVISAVVKDVTKFAVLSHTWGPDEPNHEDFLLGRNTTITLGYKKLEKFCRIAHKQYDVEFAWADTVCIDKRSSSELDESIRSMFTWYRESSICIIYLSDSEAFLDFPLDKWFTRGWTLQELLAALQIKFYNKHWKPLTKYSNEKPGSAFELSHSEQLKLLFDGMSIATGIPIDHLCHKLEPGLQDPPFPERMKWISQRSTTRPEDMSYAIMGVLGVSISVAYGEGMERAIFRLFQAVLEVDWSPSWFLWEGKPISSHIHPSRMIPSSPACYSSWDPRCDPRTAPRMSLFTWQDPDSLPPVWNASQLSHTKEPIALTNSGLPIKVLVVPAKATYSPIVTDEGIVTNITCPLSDDIVSVARINASTRYPQGLEQFALGVLNYDWWPRSIPQRIYAILLRRHYGPYRFASTQEGNLDVRIGWRCAEWTKCHETEKVLSFGLKRKFRNMEVDDWTRLEISMSEVGWGRNPHGKTIVTSDSDNLKHNTVVPRIKFQTLYL